MLTSTRYNPGPGAYDPKTTMDPKGNYFLSTMKNNGSITFKPISASEGSGLFRGNSNPGPGAYNLKVGIADKSSTFISGFTSPKARTFYHSDRVTTDIPKSIRSIFLLINCFRPPWAWKLQDSFRIRTLLTNEEIETDPIADIPMRITLSY